MCLQDRLIDIYAHLSIVVTGGGFHLITDEIDRNHILDAYTEVQCALRELRNAPRAALIETIPNSEKVDA